MVILKNKFLERERAIRRIDAAAQEQKDSYTLKYFKQVPKGDYHSKYRPTTENTSPMQSSRPTRPSQAARETSRRSPAYSGSTDNDTSMEDAMEIDTHNVFQSAAIDTPLVDESPPVQNLIDEFTPKREPVNAIHEVKAKMPRTPSNPFQSGKKKRRKRSSLHY